ncbi:MAG: ABC transporter substrate binding protein [Gammaproteobacteria bacterium]|nr:ABC transporter substrate binding protein [Gammaproteobacteria bacterium]
MMGIIFHRWKITDLVSRIVFLCLAIASSAHAEIESIHIIKSSDNDYFNRSIETIIKATKADIKYRISTLDSSGQLNQESLGEPDLVITLGIDAAEYTHDSVRDKSVIHSYITEFQRYQFNQHENHSALLLDQPLQRYLDFLKLIVPVKGIGIISTSQHAFNTVKIEQHQRQSGVKIEQRVLNDNDNLLENLRGLLKGNEVLLSLPSPQIYNRQTLKGILLTSYRMRKPVISYSPSHVRSGALAAIYASPEKIGIQLAELVNRLLSQPDYQLPAFIYADDFEVVFNRRVAESLDIELPDKAKVIQILKQGTRQ